MPLNDELAVALEDAYAAGYKAGQRNEPHDGLPHPRADRERRLWNAWGNGYADGRRAALATAHRVRRA